MHFCKHNTSSTVRLEHTIYANHLGQVQKTFSVEKGRRKISVAIVS